ncbi:MAG: TetR/AcrR family transcriptional regulator, partial [Cyclobacteriaceae bacterium]|nr:TetR/AcrR family transcriptional regulator [Cyclobacteriaceae bacterium]
CISGREIRIHFREWNFLNLNITNLYHMPRPDNSKQKWIEKGYEHFALYGPENISINAISKEIGSPRASFYHHFSDMEVFINFLLETHLDVFKSYVEEGKEYCDCLIPDFYQLLEKYPMGLKLQR